MGAFGPAPVCVPAVHTRVCSHAGPPDPPNVTRDDAGIVDLRWGAADSGGAPILGYRIVAVVQHDAPTLVPKPEAPSRCTLSPDA